MSPTNLSNMLTVIMVTLSVINQVWARAAIPRLHEEKKLLAGGGGWGSGGWLGECGGEEGLQSVETTYP